MLVVLRTADLSLSPDARREIKASMVENGKWNDLLQEANSGLHLELP